MFQNHRRFLILELLTTLALLFSAVPVLRAAPPQQGNGDSYPPITAQNAAGVTALASFTGMGKQYPPYLLAFSPDGKRIAAAGENTVWVWDWTTGQLLLSFDLPLSIASVAFHPTRNLLAVAGRGFDDKNQVNLTSLMLWDLDSNWKSADLPPMTSSWEQNPIMSDLAFSPDGTLLAVGGYDSSEMLDTNTWQPVWQSDQSAGDLAFSPDGQTIAGTSFQPDTYVDGVRITDARTGEEVRFLEISGFSCLVVAFSPDGRKVACGEMGSEGVAGGVVVWNLPGGDVLSQFTPMPDYPDAYVGGLAFNADSTLLAVGATSKVGDNSSTGFSSLWDITSGQQIAEMPTLDDGGVWKTAFSPDGSIWASLEKNALVLRGVGAPLAAAPLVPGPTPAAVAAGTASALVKGTAGSAITATYLSDGRQCPIAQGETLLGVAQTLQGILAYASGPGCEGPVLLTEGQYAWESSPKDLPHSQAQVTTFTPLETVDDYDTKCANAAPGGQYPAGGPPYTLFASSDTSLYSEALQATDQTGIDVIICSIEEEVTVETCAYQSTTNGAVYDLRRVQTLAHVSIVNYETDLTITTRDFAGSYPPECPAATTGGDFYGDHPWEEDWGPWVEAQLNGGVSVVQRTVVSAITLNARSEPNTQAEIVAHLDQNTPVSLIARNDAGDWVVALLPDMSKAWLYANLLAVANRTDIPSLPVASGPAAEVAVPLPN